MNKGQPGLQVSTHNNFFPTQGGVQNMNVNMNVNVNLNVNVNSNSTKNKPTSPDARF